METEYQFKEKGFIQCGNIRQQHLHSTSDIRHFSSPWRVCSNEKWLSFSTRSSHAHQTASQVFSQLKRMTLYVYIYIYVEFRRSFRLISSFSPWVCDQVRAGKLSNNEHNNVHGLLRRNFTVWNGAYFSRKATIEIGSSSGWRSTMVAQYEWRFIVSTGATEGIDQEIHTH